MVQGTALHLLKSVMPARRKIILQSIVCQHEGRKLMRYSIIQHLMTAVMNFSLTNVDGFY
jgi:hypothetical protein